MRGFVDIKGLANLTSARSHPTDPARPDCPAAVSCGPVTKFLEGLFHRAGHHHTGAVALVQQIPCRG